MRLRRVKSTSFSVRNRYAQSVKKTLLSHGEENVAAFIAEPVMGAGGVVIPPAGYFAAIQPILEEHDILLIDDEVICGFGRTGNWWGAHR